MHNTINQEPIINRLLTTEELYITPEIKQMVEANKENQGRILEMLSYDPTTIPLLAFAYYSIDEYKNLDHKLRFQQFREEFAVNAYFYLLDRQTYYTSDKTNVNAATELAFEDLKDLYKSYDF